jgi:hypothetical protein
MVSETIITTGELPCLSISFRVLLLGEDDTERYRCRESRKAVKLGESPSKTVGNSSMRITRGLM